MITQNQINLDLQDKVITERGIDAIIDFYHCLAIEEIEISGVRGFITGVQSPFLNVLFDTRKNRMQSNDLVVSFESFFEKHHVPWGWFVIPASEANDLIQFGFKLIEEAPAMYFDLAYSLPTTHCEDITIKEAGRLDDLKKWIEVINEGYQVKEDDDRFHQLNAKLLSKGEDRLKHFVLYNKGEVASAGTLYLSKDAIMIHNVATKSNFKNQGLATLLTLHMMNIAKKQGYKHCYLDASTEAFNLYKRIGFKVYCKTLIYSKF